MSVTPNLTKICTNKLGKSSTKRQRQSMKWPSVRIILILSAAVLCPVRGELDAETGLECVDSNELCALWAASDECTKNRTWMHANCKKSCDRCKIVRVGSADEMNSFIMKKKKEIAEKRDAQKRAKAALEGKTSGDEL